MVPNTFSLDTVDTDVESSLAPSTTYYIDWESKRITGLIDGIDAIYQFIDKALITDKYAYSLYTQDYGNELYKLLGQDADYIKARIPMVIEDALMSDDRILSVDNFNYSQTKGDELIISFTVHSILGSIDYTKEVQV